VFFHPRLNPNPVKAEDVKDPRTLLFLSLTPYLLGIFFIVIILYLGTFPQGFIDVAKEAVAAAI
jgi:hypothetical protein